MVSRLEKFFLTKSFLIEDALIGQTQIKVNDTSPFTKEAINNAYPELFIQNDSSTFKAIPNGREGASLIRISQIVDDKTLVLQEPLTSDWLVSDNSFIRRAIIGRAGGSSGDIVNKIILGDVEVIDKYPAISIIPTSKTIDWRTLSSTRDTVNIDFVVYMKKGNTEASTESVLILADIMEWILMSNLHIKPLGYKERWEVTNIARVKSVQYGTIARGSEFLKAATLTWEAELHFFRGYLTQQGLDDSVTFGYGNLENFGPLPPR